MTGAATAGDQSWRTTAEKGSMLGARFVFWLVTTFGRGPGRLFVRILALYYALFARDVRRVVRIYLKQLGEPVTFGRVYRQVLRFAQVALDSLFLLGGQFDRFRIQRTGTEHLQALREKRQGAILLGAHHGSMYAMRAQGGAARFPVYPVMYTKHAARANAILREVDPDGHTRIIQMGEGVDFMLRMRELIEEEGAIMALLADRVGADDRAVTVDFLGAPARFPVGPYILASMLKCPVYLAFGLYRDPNGYELYCEPFAERIELPRKRRQEALQEYAQAYARRLEHYVRLAPDNWFNFYDFWRKAEAGDE